MSVATENDQAAAVRAALVAALGAPWPVFDTDQDPGTRPADYVELTVVRRFGGELRNGGYKATESWRLLTRYVSQSYVQNVRTMRAKVRDALEEKPLAVSGGTTTPVQFETGEAAGVDEGWFTALDTWTWTL